ncbi:MAG: DUF72 domain-containing protein [Thermoplasmata archaeon]|nr:DUF72 domain-containing protein [Thermoplasmata archaeon]MCI4359637.1 DUF72 domain-containing protein [Thermoplasmata archaeon]
MQLHIGCSSWTSDSWWGKVYPSGIRDGDRLSRYASLYDTVEVDSTYYRPPAAFLVRRWASVTPDRFVFTLKFPRDLLDPKQAVDRGQVGAFLESARLLGPKLGPILLQFPPWVKPGRAGTFLTELLEALDPALRYSVELRDAGWFQGSTWKALRSELSDRRIALAWSYLTYVDVPPERTTDFVYLRFIGDHHTLPDSTHGEIRLDRTPELRTWAARLKGVEETLHEAFVFFNNHFAGFAPESVNQFRREWGLPRVEFQVAEPSSSSDGPSRRGPF